MASTFGAGIKSLAYAASAVSALSHMPYAKPATAWATTNCGHSQRPVCETTCNHGAVGCAALRSTVNWYGHVLGLPVRSFHDFFFFQAEDGIRDWSVTGVQTCALPILLRGWLQ